MSYPEIIMEVPIKAVEDQETVRSMWPRDPQGNHSVVVSGEGSLEPVLLGNQGHLQPGFLSLTSSQPVLWPQPMLLLQHP